MVVNSEEGQAVVAVVTHLQEAHMPQAIQVVVAIAPILTQAAIVAITHIRQVPTRAVMVTRAQQAVTNHQTPNLTLVLAQMLLHLRQRLSLVKKITELTLP